MNIQKIVVTVLVVCIACVVLVALAGMYKFNYLASLPGYDVDGNKIEVTDTFEVIEVLGQSCQTDNDCETPAAYAIQSHCPYDSICIENSCTVICPAPFNGHETNALDSKDATYTVDGEHVTLVNGVSEKNVTPDSATKIITRYFGNDVQIDLNNDGRADSVFLLTQETGGTGTFFYVAAALQTEDGWEGTHAYFLGDRIAPQSTAISDNPNHQNVIVVTYADREPGQPMSAEPSVGKSVWLKFDPMHMQFGEVVQDFLGEADPDGMSLEMKPWTWVRTTYANDSIAEPKKADAFTMTFTHDGSVSVTTDCNAMSGTYALEGKQITFGPMAATMMYCEDSQEAVFSKMLSEVHSYFFTAKGELVFDLKFDSGSVVFR